MDEPWWGERALREVENERLARQQDRKDAEAFFAICKDSPNVKAENPSATL